MVRNNTSGFTLIETILATTISASLAMIALYGFSTLRGQAQFTSAVDTLKETVLKVRTEAFTTVNLAGSGGTNGAQVILGKVITFKNHTSTVTVQNVIAVNSINPSNVTITADRTITLPWGITYEGAADARITFIKSASTAAQIVSVGSGSYANGSTTSYSNVSTDQSSVSSLRFVDPSGRQAWIDVDPTNGGITRRYQ